MNKIAIAALFSMTSSVALAGPFTYNTQNDVYQSSANGTPTANDHNDGSPDLYEAANHLLGTSYTSNADLDNRFIANDSIFYGTGKSSVALIGLTAGHSNTLGIYDDIGTGNNKQAVIGPVSGFGTPHQGTSSDPYLAGEIDIAGDFGWYLSSKDGNNHTETFYSETALNRDGIDHMMTFEMSELNGETIYINTGSGSEAYTFDNAFMIGWEDLHLNHSMYDDDYDDMIFVVDFRPDRTYVSEPASIALMGFGLLLAGAGRLRKKK